MGRRKPGSVMGRCKPGKKTGRRDPRGLTWNCAVKLNLAPDNFFQRNTSKLMFGGIYVDARPSSALKLLAALCGQDDQAVFGINLL